MNEKEIYERIRESIHLTDIEIIKIIIRFAMWHNSFYHTSSLDIVYFFKEYIKSAKMFEKICHRILYFNLCITGFINFCEFLKIQYPTQKELMESKNRCLEIENILDAIIYNIETYFTQNNMIITYSEVYKFVVEMKMKRRD